MLATSEACLICEVIDVLYAGAGLLFQSEEAFCCVDQVVHDSPHQGGVRSFILVSVAKGVQFPLQSSCLWLVHTMWYWYTIWS